ncbi:MAG: phenylalanine--tRNA ligase subunit alpha [Actinomycetota bacterium]|nr:phenylalanine--tRNA ligase subunit alpha [Actinomycetota bacterium]
MDTTTNLTDPMNLAETLESLRADSVAQIDAAADIESLDGIAAAAVGRESPIATARRGLGSMPAEDRRDAGRLINEIAKEIEAVVATRREALLAQERAAAIAGEAIDVTVDYLRLPTGRLHVIQQVLDEVCDIFVGLGYHIAEGPEAELGWYNFDALNTPPDHPGRLESDTMYLDYGDPADEMLLRAHTSPVQARYMEAHEPPVYIVAPGKAYRNDTIDATHLPVFHQIEGLAVDESITFSDLKGTLAEFARQFFGPGTHVRMRPHFFPFTEPSAELDVSCFNCDGGESSCRVCRGVGWLEMLGCGMVDPAVFTAVGYDPDAVTGFAFGVGVERLAMVRHGIDSIRHFVDNDVRFLDQFPG